MPERGIIVLEGPDGAGKTTLAHHLVDTYGARYLHGRVFEDCWKSHTAMLRLAARWSQDGLVVLDRHWPSEAIYGPLFRGRSQYSPNERSVERVLLKHAALYVMVLPSDLKWLERRFEELRTERREDFPTVSNVAKRYAELWAGNPIFGTFEGTYTDQLTKLGGVSRLFNWFRYDIFHSASMAEQAKSIVHKLRVVRKLQLKQALTFDQFNVTGHLHSAQVLFVGDQLGDPSLPVKWPFYAKNNSSAFLNASLHKIGYPEHHAMFLNANDEGENLFMEIVTKKPSIKVIALGDAAQRGILAKHGKYVKAKVYHPSYARRFMHYGNYPDLLWEAING